MFYLGQDSVREMHAIPSHRISPRSILRAFSRALFGLMLLLPLRAHASGALQEVHLRIAGKEVTGKSPALADDSETYIPLETLHRVGASGTVSHRGDTVLVTAGERHAEIAIARLKGTPMIALSDLAHLMNAAVVRPPATDRNHKPILVKPGDTVYLLARVEEVQVEAEGVRVKTSFPVPYRIGMVENAAPPRGYVECEGAVVAAEFQSHGAAANEKRAHGVQLHQMRVDTARISIELDEGVALHSIDAGDRPAASILAALERAPVSAPPAARPADQAGREVAQSVDLTPADTPGQRSEAQRSGAMPGLRAQAPDDGGTRVVESPVQSPAPPDDPSHKGRKQSGNHTDVATTDRNQAGGTDVDTEGDQTPGTAKPGSNTASGITTKSLPSRSGPVQRPAIPIVVSSLEFITDNMSHARVEIATSGKAAASIHYLPGTTQLVLDIPNAKLKLPEDDDGERKLNHPLVSHIGITLPDDAPGSARVTLDMDRILGYTLVAQPDKLVLELRIPRNATGALADKLIVVDPGHGGKATGASGHGDNGVVYEKNITLAIAMKLRTALEACGARVVMTRDNDIDVGLYDRTRMANSIGADLFISIHNDSSPRAGSASGTSTYYHMNDPSSRALAICVQDAVHAVTGLPSRGALSDGILYTSGLAVLRTTNMPAVLCEVAYINNARDRNKLVDPDFQQRVAQAMCNGLRAYVEGQPKPTPDLKP